MQPMPARRVFALFAALFALPSIATAAPGFAMRWDRCYADAGGSNKNFACNTNSGTETLVITFSPDTAIANLSGIEIYLDIQSASASIPAWWQLKNTGTCRQGAISVNMTADPVPFGATTPSREMQRVASAHTTSSPRAPIGSR